MIDGLEFCSDRQELFSSARLGLEIAEALGVLYPGQMNWEKNRALIGNTTVIQLGDRWKAPWPGQRRIW